MVNTIWFNLIQPDPKVNLFNCSNIKRIMGSWPYLEVSGKDFWKYFNTYPCENTFGNHQFKQAVLMKYEIYLILIYQEE